jgi:hypothetical protein
MLKEKKKGRKVLVTKMAIVVKSNSEEEDSLETGL